MTPDDIEDFSFTEAVLLAVYAIVSAGLGVGAAWLTLGFLS